MPPPPTASGVVNALTKVGIELGDQKARNHRIDAPKVVNRLYQAHASPNRVKPS
jgi:hypothetical protein